MCSSSLACPSPTRPHTAQLQLASAPRPRQRSPPFITRTQLCFRPGVSVSRTGRARREGPSPGRGPTLGAAGFARPGAGGPALLSHGVHRRTSILGCALPPASPVAVHVSEGNRRNRLSSVANGERAAGTPPPSGTVTQLFPQSSAPGCRNAPVRGPPAPGRWPPSTKTARSIKNLTFVEAGGWAGTVLMAWHCLREQRHSELLVSRHFCPITRKGLRSRVNVGQHVVADCAMSQDYIVAFDFFQHQ